tara:strand:+ start:1140 stop:1388 length:249 start_codon:yes stop_codon:yes gene_type:complete
MKLNTQKSGVFTLVTLDTGPLTAGCWLKISEGLTELAYKQLLGFQNWNDGINRFQYLTYQTSPEKIRQGVSFATGAKGLTIV